jgi:hypothetical protein
MPVSYLAVLFAGIVNMALGAFWYSPVLFGSQWMKLSGLTKKDLEATKKKGMQKEYGMSFVAGLVLAYALGMLLSRVSIASSGEAAAFGAMVGVGFVATTKLPDTLWNKKPLMLWVINSGYSVVSLALMGIIFTVL